MNLVAWLKWMVMAAADSVRTMFLQIGNALPRILGAVIILVVGLLIARAVRWALSQGLKKLPIDGWSKKFGVYDFLQKGEVKYQLSELVGVFAYWVILLAFLLGSLDVLGMTAAAGLLEKVLQYIPQVLAGVIVLILGLFLATVVSGIVQTASANAGISQAKGLGQISRVAVIIFTAAIALEKFFSSMIIQTTFTIVLAAVSFGMALAFGLGCKEIAGKAVDDFIHKVRGGR